jgi:hypothetical protein
VHKYITTIILSCWLILLSACTSDVAPTVEESIGNFYINQQSFTELSKLICLMGNKKQPFSSKIDSFTYRISEIQVENRIVRLDTLLIKIGIDYVYYKRPELGGCTFVANYYQYGFAGSGKTYHYKFNLQNPILFDESKHSSKEHIKQVKGVYKFDMPLADNWYFSYKAS